MRGHFFICFFYLASSFLQAQNFYQTDQIQKIELHFTQSNWDYILDTSKLGKDKHVMAAWVKINGQKLDSVGVKYKGNSSYDSTYLKNPLHIELNTYKDQNYLGYVDIKLGNAYADPSLIREVLSYNLLKQYMDCPESNFAQVYINGIYMGLYSNSESINKQFCRNHFFDDKGSFVKCNPLLTPSSNVKSNLKYKAGGDSSSYQNYYELKSNTGWKNLEALCDSITNHPNNMNTVFDLDRALWMLAFNNVCVNLDSYSGVFAQNYYVYKDQHHRFLPVVWDLNMSFGGFPFMGNTNSSLAALSISGLQTLPIAIHSTDAFWPLIKGIYANPSFKKMYVAHLKTMTEECVASNLYATEYQKYYTLIDTAVLSDSKKFYTYTQFQNAFTSNYSVGSYSVPGIQTLMSARLSYLQNSADFALATPTITSVNPRQSPAYGTSITFTAAVNNANNVQLGYRFSTSEPFQKLSLLDDGVHGDGAANDKIYGASLTFSSNQIQYYVYAENANAGIFSPLRAEHEFYELTLLPHPQKGQIVINEFLADNKSDVRNEFNSHSDWIELFNTSNTTLSLSDYYLSNSINESTKFSFPATASIAPHGFMQVWADEMVLPGNQLHANFKLNKDRDQIILSNGLKTLLDTLSFSSQNEDVSTGRCPDGTGTFSLLKFPSYGLPNCIVGLDELELLAGALIVFPNPAAGSCHLRVTTNEAQNLKVFDQLGELIFETTFEYDLQLNTNNWLNGVYFLQSNGITKKLIITK